VETEQGRKQLTFRIKPDVYEGVVEVMRRRGRRSANAELNLAAEAWVYMMMIGINRDADDPEAQQELAAAKLALEALCAAALDQRPPADRLRAWMADRAAAVN
jgi:hypothetical protein